MTLKEQINKDYMTAFKTKDVVAKNLLSVIKGEIQTIEKNTGSVELSDEEVTKILQKTVKSLKDTISVIESGNTTDNESSLTKTKQELEIASGYLPKQMSKEEIKNKVLDLRQMGITQIGSIMKEFSNLPADKKIVSEVIKETQV